MGPLNNDQNPLKAGYLPGLDVGEVNWETLEFNNNGQTCSVLVPSLSAAQYEGLVKRVQTIGMEQLQRTPLSEILKAIDKVVVGLLDTKSSTMIQALEILPKVTGFDPEMMRLTLHSYLQTFKCVGLKRFLAQDFSNPQVLEEFVPNVRGGLSRAVPPSLTLHSWSGNVPALGMWSLVSALLVKAPSIGKVASAEPLFVTWFVRLLVHVLPQIKDALAIVWWRGGDHTQCMPLLNASELVVAYGNDLSLQNLKSSLPRTTRFLGYGHKLSFALLSRSSMNRALIADCVSKAAWDVIAHDKGGCYSPHVFYVQKGGAVTPEEFAQRLLAELKLQASRFPSSQSDLSEKTDQESWLQSQRFKSIQSNEVQILGYKGSTEVNDQAWVVFHDEVDDLIPSPSKRFVQVVAFENWSQVINSLSKARPYLQTVGTALSTSELAEVTPMLAQAGVTRIAAIGSMTAPEAGWHHDGRFGLADLVNMVDVELSAISIGESFDEYRI